MRKEVAIIATVLTAIALVASCGKKDSSTTSDTTSLPGTISTAAHIRVASWTTYAASFTGSTNWKRPTSR
jgi:hypothetical protein